MAEPAYRSLRWREGTRWPAPGRWTYDDYCRLPDDGNRYEVIRGVLYVTAAPRWEHQFSVGKLVRFFDVFVSAADLGIVLPAPLDVKLPRGIASPVQPDVAVFRKGNEPCTGVAYFEGVPDVIVEVLSPRTGKRDRTLKLHAYQEAGVPEYWLVNPAARTVVVYVLEKAKYTELARGGVGDEVWSVVLPGLRVRVGDLFAP